MGLKIVSMGKICEIKQDAVRRNVVRQWINIAMLSEQGYHVSTLETFPVPTAVLPRLKLGARVRITMEVIK